MNDNRPIGIFDSGIGGLTVMQAIMKLLPGENLVYFGDTARLPYGEKSPETILRYSIENVTFLLKHEVKAIVIACNTATACAIHALRDLYDLPIIGVIEPGVEKALRSSSRLAVLGTRATIRSGVYQREILKREPQAKVISIACPLLVPLVEENMVHHPATRLILQDHLKAITEVDTLLLGCTHYPLLTPLIQEELGPDIQVINSAVACAEALYKTLKEGNLLNHGDIGSHQFFVSDDPLKFQWMGSAFLGSPLEEVGLQSQRDLSNPLICN